MTATINIFTFSFSFLKFFEWIFFKGILDSVTPVEDNFLPPYNGAFPKRVLGILHSFDKEKTHCLLYELLLDQPKLARMVGTA